VLWSITSFLVWEEILSQLHDELQLGHLSSSNPNSSSINPNSSLLCVASTGSRQGGQATGSRQGGRPITQFSGKNEQRRERYRQTIAAEKFFRAFQLTELSFLEIVVHMPKEKKQEYPVLGSLPLLQQLHQNVQMLLKDFPERSHFGPTLTARLGEGQIPGSFLGVSPNHLKYCKSKSKKKEEIAQELFQSRYAFYSSRVRVTEPEIEAICEWAKAHLGTRSGSSGEAYKCTEGKENFYLRYLNNLGEIFASLGDVSYESGTPGNSFSRNLEKFQKWVQAGRPNNSASLVGRGYECFFKISIKNRVETQTGVMLHLPK
jgi:hypothetical protein